MSYKINIRLQNDKGVTLLIVAASLVVILGMCALGIDLVAGYLARVQCQRAADAAALAGARAFVASACTSTGGCVAGGPQETPATRNAISAAAQNPVMGLAPTASTISIAFSYPDPSEPVYRDSTHTDPLPTTFAKIFGINSMNVSASATAEAYNGQIGAGCVKPFLVPNCDPNFPVNANDYPDMANTYCHCGGGGVTQGDCPSGYTYSATTPYVMSYYVYPIGSSQQGHLVHPGDCNWDGARCTNGDIGAPWVLHNNLNATVPSQWYTIAFTTQSGEAYSTYISQCAPEWVACGTTLDTLNGKKVGPTNKGIEDLIHANGQGLNQGQDYMCSPSYDWPIGSGNYCSSSTSTSTGQTYPPFPIYGGANNTIGYVNTQFDMTMATSDSDVSVVLYDGQPLSSGGGSVVVQGYMSLFIQYVDHQNVTDNVYAVVTQIGACGGGTSGPSTSTTATSNGGSFIPIRLIRPN